MVSFDVKKYFSARTFSILILFSFLFLNIADFLNLLQGDIDLFEKITSWYAVGYIFYLASFSKITIGKRVKGYDFLYILAFSLFTIPKSLVLYAFDFNLNSFSFFSFLVPFFEFIAHFTDSFLFFSFIGAFFLIAIISISMLVNNEVEEKSLIGSFKFKDSYFGHFGKNFLLIIFGFFFGLIVFNFIMEWFALAIDDLILILGLFYYFYVYINKHTNIDLSYLEQASNTGNEFFENLIEFFSDKKTFFIGVSFLLTIHLLVDAGVYLVPYVTGVENGLYFVDLDNSGSLHTALFNFMDFGSSLFLKDIHFVSGDLIMVGSILLIYFSTLFFLFSMMLLPFYIFYMNVNRSKIKFSKFFSILFLVSMVSFVLLLALPNVNSPIGFKVSSSTKVTGVDMFTQYVADDVDFGQLLGFIMFFLTFLIFLIFRFDSYKFIFEKIILLSILIFFVIYLMMFFYGVITDDISKLNAGLKGGNVINSEDKFEKLFLKFEESKVDIAYRGGYKFSSSVIDMNLSVIPFFVWKDERNKGVYSEHDDYFLIEVSNVDMSKRFSFDNLNLVYMQDLGAYNFDKYVANSRNFTFIYYVGENEFEINSMSNGMYRVLSLFRTEDFNLIFTLRSRFFEDFRHFFDNINRYLRVFFLSLFYVGGTGLFVYFYARSNFFNLQS